MKKKVIFLIGTLSSGGAERVVSYVSMNLPSNIEREIIIFGNEAKVDYEYKGKITYLDRASLNNPIMKFIILFNRIRKIRDIKKKNKKSTVISFLEYPNLLNILAGINKNSIVSVRNFMSKKHKKGLKALFWNFTIKYLYRKARNIIVVSKFMKDDLVDNYNLPSEKIKVIYNSYPLYKIEQSAKELIPTEERKIFGLPTIITAGRLETQKGQKHLINAFIKVKKEIPNVQLVFLGEGRLESALKQQAIEANVQDSVHFLGFKKNPYKFVANSNVFVMTSYYEGFPNALAEAMACKIPIISTDCPSGPREILAPNELDEIIDYSKKKNLYGILVPPFDNKNEKEVESMISESILELLNSMEKQDVYAKKSYERIKDFDIEAIIKEWEQLADL